MKNLITNKWTTFTLAMTCLVLICALIAEPTTPTAIEQEPIIKYVEVISEDPIDTTYIEKVWCGDFNNGHIRMIGAWWYADGVVEDEQGRLWGVEQSISEDDFLLLWIADNYTPDNVIDDVILKVWREAY